MHPDSQIPQSEHQNNKKNDHQKQQHSQKSSAISHPHHVIRTSAMIPIAGFATACGEGRDFPQRLRTKLGVNNATHLKSMPQEQEGGLGSSSEAGRRAGADMVDSLRNLREVDNLQMVGSPQVGESPRPRADDRMGTLEHGSPTAEVEAGNVKAACPAAALRMALEELAKPLWAGGVQYIDQRKHWVDKD
jgi:hypothetical protein